MDGSGTVDMYEHEAGAILEALAKSDPAKLFQAMDQDGNRTVDRREFAEVVRATKGCKSVANASIALAFKAIDTDGSEEVDWKELHLKLHPDRIPAHKALLPKLMAGRKSKALGSLTRLDGAKDGKSVPMVLATLLRKNLARAIDLFRDWDVDADGQVSALEFRRAIEALGFLVPRAEVDLLFSHMDKDGSGSIEFRELHRALHPRNLDSLAKAMERDQVGGAMAVGVGDGDVMEDEGLPEDVQVLKELEKQLKLSEAGREAAVAKLGATAQENAEMNAKLEAAASERSMGVLQLASLARKMAESRAQWAKEEQALRSEVSVLRGRVAELEETTEKSCRPLEEAVAKLKADKRVLKAQLQVLSEEVYSPGGTKRGAKGINGGMPAKTGIMGPNSNIHTSLSSPTASTNVAFVTSSSYKELDLSPHNIDAGMSTASGSTYTPRSERDAEFDVVRRERMEERTRAREAENKRIAAENREITRRRSQVVAKIPI